MRITSTRSISTRVLFSLLLVPVGLVLLAAAVSTWADQSQWADLADPIVAAKWGAITAPVFGSSESVANGAYSDAELFAGPDKFGDYFSGVLPNGRIVKPAGVSIQIGMNPLGAVLTPDDKFLITSNDDEREAGFPSYQSTVNKGGYSLSVVNTSTAKVVSQINVAGTFYIGLQATGPNPDNSYTIWASGGPNNNVKLFTVASDGTISQTGSIPIAPITPATSGYVSNYTPAAALNTADNSGNKPPVPSGFDRVNGAKITFPAGSALSPDRKFLYVACNGDNSVAVINTSTHAVVRQVPVGAFPYGVALSQKGDVAFVSNWGITEYKFLNPTYAADGTLTAVGAAADNQPDGFYVPVQSKTGSNPKSSSISVLSAPQGDATQLSPQGAFYEGHPLDQLYKVGDTHPSAITTVSGQFGQEVVYVTKTNSDSLGVLLLSRKGQHIEISRMPDVPLSPTNLSGGYPNALAVSPDQKYLYVAEAGINSVAILSISNPLSPRLVGRIPTGWYPTALALSSDGRYLYVTNAKGIGEDINPQTNTAQGNAPPTGLASDPTVDSNFIFGTVQQVDLQNTHVDNLSVLKNNFAFHMPVDTSVVPVGREPSRKIKHVFFILHENKTFDSMLGNQGSHFGPFASQTFNKRDGSTYNNGQYTGVSVNTQRLAMAFATAVNYFSDSEESDAGHQFCASGTSSDYTQKTLLVKSGRGLLVNKNFEPEDYPESGYIFNNAARNGVSFKDYGAMVRIEGTDTGTSTPTTLNDPLSGLVGYPQLQGDNFTVTNPLINSGDVTSQVQGLGQTYFLKLPILAVLGGKNFNGEPRLDRNYPGYNFNISDQRRALEFISDFDRMVAGGTLPRFLYIYQPNDHTGGVQAPNSGSVVTASGVQQIADGDVGLGMVVKHIMESPVYYDPQTGTGSAIFITYDDAQSSLDHIHPHRTPLIVVSPFAKPGYVGKRHYSTASVVKTEELLLGLPPNNLGDLLATDLRDLFQANYNGIAANDVVVTTQVAYTPSKEGKHIWSLVSKLDTSGPDRDSFRLGALLRLSMRADELHQEAERKRSLGASAYKRAQADLYKSALRLVNTAAPRDIDG